MTEQLAFPQCIIEVYPFEGGVYSIAGGQILSLTAEKSIRADTGRFTIVLAPGGPGGPNYGPSWTEIFTPMSFVMIGMQRAGVRRIIMVGVISNISEQTKWSPGKTVQRQTTIVGYDFAYFFAMFGYYSLFFLGLTPGANLIPDQPAAGLATMAQALLEGPPDEVGKSWYTNVMAGTKGILADTFVPYRGTRVLFPFAMATLFQPWKNFIIPFADYFISAEGSWLDKFRLIFPFPWYEFFVITAPPEFYPGTQAAPIPFAMQAFGDSPSVSPTLVARINPNPVLTVSAGAFTGVDSSLWDALPIYDLGDTGFIESTTGFSDEGIKNFFTLNPVWFRALLGFANTGVSSYPFLYNSAGDPASIHRYGFRPADGTMNWLADPTGNQAVASTGGAPADLLNDLTVRLASWSEPAALMAAGAVTTVLRPDIIPGNRFRYQPFKNQKTYDFYISAVRHNFVFGGESTTSLVLERGLPTEVYSDPALMQAVLSGGAQRLDGVVSPGIPTGLGPGLETLTVGQFTRFMNDLGGIYQTPGAR